MTPITSDKSFMVIVIEDFPDYRSDTVYSGAVVCTVTSQQEVSGFRPTGQMKLFCSEFQNRLWFPPTFEKYADLVNWLISNAHRCQCECERLFVSALALR